MSSSSTIKLPPPTGLPCDAILRIANQDAAAVYRDLSDFQITLALRSDGWHVDYDLTEPLVASGGPHYIIDPMTGEIRSKRYEQ